MDPDMLLPLREEDSPSVDSDELFDRKIRQNRIKCIIIFLNILIVLEFILNVVVVWLGVEDVKYKILFGDTCGYINFSIITIAIFDLFSLLCGLDACIKKYKRKLMLLVSMGFNFCFRMFSLVSLIMYLSHKYSSNNSTQFDCNEYKFSNLNFWTNMINCVMFIVPILLFCKIAQDLKN